MRRAISLAVLISVVASVAAADDVVTSKGFVAGAAYAGDLARVNLFNGALAIVLPVGQTYQANGVLPYGFTPSYSGNNWEKRRRPATVCIQQAGGGCSSQTTVKYYMAPSKRSNAGVGWRFSSGGELVNSDAGDPTKYAYQSGDGARYAFSATPTAHPPDSIPTSPTRKAARTSG